MGAAIAGFGFIYSTYMLVLVVELWLVFRPSIVERAVSRGGVGTSRRNAEQQAAKACLEELQGS